MNFSSPLRGALVVWLGVVLVSSAVGCNKKAPEATASTDTPVERVPVATKFDKAQVKMLEMSIELSGTLAAAETSEVAALVPGAVTKVNVDVGSRVKKGDVMVELDRREAALRAAQASAQQRQASDRLGAGMTGGKFDPNQVPEVRAAKEASDLAQMDADRTKALLDTGAVSPAAWDQARTRAEQARSQYDSALAAAKQGQAALAGASAATGLASKSVSDSLIRAPFEGSVAEKRISVGEYATPGKVMVVVVSDNPVRLKIDVPEADVGRLKADAKVEATVAAYPERVFEGVVKRIGASVRQQSRALPVEAEIRNDDGALRPGMFARARVVVPGAPTRAIVVPMTAVGNTGSNARIFVKTGDKVVERLVVTGRHAGNQVEVIGELKEGEEVAVSDLDKLSDGTAVTVR